MNEFNKDFIIAGDIHGMWRYLNALINKKHPKYIFQCGDFGWWPGRKIATRVRGGMRIRGFDPLGVRAGKTEVYWCPGNHENWEELELRKAIPSEVMPNVFYMRRGSTIQLADGRVVLFMGGGISIDRNARTHGVDWFPQEIIPYSEIYKLEANEIDKVDIIISHTCPLEFKLGLIDKIPYNGWEWKFHDPSQEVLSTILEMYKPSLWYFGHFHVNSYGQYNNTKWYCLNDVPNTEWWRYLSNYGI